MSNVKVVKNFIEKKSHTMLRVVPKSRHAFDKHCREMDRSFMGLS